MMEEQVVGKGEEKKVCVTGGSGFIASWIIKLLLQQGYTVNATLRNLSTQDPTKTEHLLALDGAKERLHLFEANLLQEGSFDSAIRGCVGVFHTASPIILGSDNPQVEVIDPAVKGTLNVLSSCTKAPSVKRVVFTSSTAAVIHNGRPVTNETIVDETWFSTPEGCKGKIGECYLMSKTLAEDAAWKFAKENGIDMVSINPGAVIGPILQQTMNFSNDFFVYKLIGSETYPNATFSWVHVKDVAEAHIRAFEIPSANGRCESDQELEPTYTISKEKIRTLRIEYIPLKTALKDTIECLREKFDISV